MTMKNRDINSNWIFGSNPNMTKGNNDTCVSILCHSRAMTRESRNKDIMPLDTRIKYENDNVDTIPTGSSAQAPSMTKDNNDICVSILCHSQTKMPSSCHIRALTRISRNEDVNFINKDIIFWILGRDSNMIK